MSRPRVATAIGEAVAETVQHLEVGYTERSRATLAGLLSTFARGLDKAFSTDGFTVAGPIFKVICALRSPGKEVELP